MYTFTRISSDLLSELASLMGSAYSVAPSEAELIEKFSTAGQGASYVGFIAHHNVTGEVAAFYGVFPVRVKLGGREMLAAQSGDTVTHPDHRGKGLFITLATMTYALAAECGVAFVFGYPNSSSYPGFVNKLNWSHPFNMKLWSYYVPTFPLKFIGNYVTFVRRLQLSLFTSLSRKLFDVRMPMELAEDIESLESTSCVIHDRVYVMQKRNRGLILCHKSVKFWIKFDGDICIGTVIDNSNGQDIKSGLRRLFILSALSGAARIKTYFSTNSILARQLSGIGFTRDSLAYGFVVLNPKASPSMLETVYLDYDTF